MRLVSEAFAAAAPARAAGPKTKDLIDKIQGVMRGYQIKPMSHEVSDNTQHMRFKGVFGKNTRAKDVKKFGGIGGKPVLVDITVAPGRQVWVNMTIWKGRASFSLASPKRDLGSTFVVIEKAVKHLFDTVLA